jgi:hypothetical protein
VSAASYCLFPLRCFRGFSAAFSLLIDALALGLFTFVSLHMSFPYQNMKKKTKQNIQPMINQNINNSFTFLKANILHTVRFPESEPTKSQKHFAE